MTNQNSREHTGDQQQYDQLDKYMKRLQAVPEGLGRAAIYEALQERIPYLRRKDCTPRVLRESGVDLLLDQLITIQHEEAFNLLLEEETWIREQSDG